MVTPLEPLLDERPQNDLEAHRKLEAARRPAREHPGTIQRRLGEDEKDSRPVVEHRHLPLLPARHVTLSVHASAAFARRFVLESSVSPAAISS